MKLKYQISFGLKNENHLSKSGEVAIRMRITYNCTRVDLLMGVSVAPELWNKSKQVAKGRGTNRRGYDAVHINAVIAQYRKAADDAMDYFTSNQIIPEPVELRDKINDILTTGIVDHTKGRDIMKDFEEYVSEKGSSHAWGSKKNNTQYKNRRIMEDLKDFFQGRKFSYEDLTLGTLNKFLDYLSEDKPLKNKRDVSGVAGEANGTIPIDSEKGLINSTIKRDIGFLKSFLNWATNIKEYNTNKDYQKFKPKLKTVEHLVVYMSEEELSRLSRFEIPENRDSLERVRDVFLFGCYTGLRYSDIYNLRRSNIKDGIIEITTQKTSSPVRVDLNNVTTRILEKYKDVPFPDDKALPVLSDQKMNDRLHELCKLAGFDEPITSTKFSGSRRIDETLPKYEYITTHTGRRSFICNALLRGVPPHIVMKWTGHKNLKTFQVYIDATNKDLETMMKKMDNPNIEI